ncbi:leucine-rich repeat flightless-interacting protein 2 isoform X1 [Hypomesus transpacificus]|uniref:leucine-rich repeat flightless-interacting protein 2 isoform X1 n=1 Tax=Hypomesus transpacificus TaxID=137520 RepID=UPI001F0722C9|nr:leucine-rich repeat flightless-interacting protein 2 isoform X1 [Hypomesus transpacificus]
MGTQVTGRKRIPNKEKFTAEDDALNQIAREAEARLAAKRAARAEAREIRMKELERQQKEIYQAQKRYYGLDNKWGHIEQWMEESERYSRLSRKHTSISDDEERMSVGSRGSLRGTHFPDQYCSTSSLPSLRQHNNSTQNGRPSDYSGFLGSSSRASSRASSARASPVVEERPDRDFIEKGSRTASTLSAATLASLGGASSRRGSCDTSFSVETEASIREMKDSLVESEEKYRKAMVSNAQLHNEKSNLMYQVDTLKESLIELEERLWESQRELSDKAKEFERVRHAHSVLQFQFSETRETLKQSEELLTEVGELRLKRDSGAREISDLQEALEWKEKKIGALERQREYSEAVRTERDLLREQVVRLTDALKKHGIALSPEVTTNGATGDGVLVHSPLCAEPGSRLAQEAQPPHIGGESMLELRLRKLVDERESLVDQVRRLKSQLEQKPRNGTEGPEEEGVENGMDPYIMDLQRDANRQISDFKFKLVKSEQEVTALEQNIIRLEGQVTRYKSASESAEKVEDELKVEKRKLQRELRSALDRIDELEASNSHLSKRLEKMKANRTALLAQQ